MEEMILFSYISSTTYMMISLVKNIYYIITNKSISNYIIKK